MRFKTGLTALAVALATFLAACGGGGGGGSLPVVDGGGGGGGDQGDAGGDSSAGVGGTGTGGASGFASVLINKGSFRKKLITSTDTVFTIDGVVVTQGDFELPKHVGLVLRYETEADSVAGIDLSAALTISGFHAVKGYVDQVAPQLMVLGQPVQVSGDTNFVLGACGGGLSVGDGAEVAGFIDDSGVVQATRIECKTLGVIDPWKVVGKVENFTANVGLDIGGLAIDTSGAVIDDNCPGGLGNGDIAEVKMTPNGSYNPAAPSAMAAKIECMPMGIALPDNPAGQVLEASIEGFVCVPPTANRIIVDQQIVQLTAATEYRGGTRADLDEIPDWINDPDFQAPICVRVEAEGDLDIGVDPTLLTADRIDFRQNRVRFDVLLDTGDIDTTNDTVKLFCDNLGNDCITAVTIPQTEDDDNIFGVGIPGPKQVEIRGFADSGNTVFIEEIELGNSNGDPDPNDIRLRGVIGATTGSPIQVATILGVEVAVENFSNFRDETGAVISKAAFQASIGVGTVISVEGAIYVAATQTLEPNLATPADAILSLED